MNKERPDFTSDLFPWKFDLEDELAEIFANHPENHTILLNLRGLFTFLFTLAMFGLLVLIYGEGEHALREKLILLAVSVWMGWLLVNEIRFFWGYYARVKTCLRGRREFFVKTRRK